MLKQKVENLRIKNESKERQARENESFKNNQNQMTLSETGGGVSETIKNLVGS